MSVTAQAVWYIESHLSSELSLDEIAGAIGVSRFHLSRAFGITVGCSLASYVRSRRLSRAAEALAAGAPDILSLALDAGYGSHEAFTRAFRQQFGLSPEQLRQRAHLGDILHMAPARPSEHRPTSSAPPRIERADALLIFGLGARHRGTNAGIPSQWDRFVPLIDQIDHRLGTETYGVICNTDEAGTMEYVCGVRVSQFPDEPQPFARLRIPPQTYAVFLHPGHVSTITGTWNGIWNHGLSAAGLEAADGPAFERYGLTFDGRTGSGGFEIWVPVRA